MSDCGSAAGYDIAEMVPGEPVAAFLAWPAVFHRAWRKTRVRVARVIRRLSGSGHRTVMRKHMLQAVKAGRAAADTDAPTEQRPLTRADCEGAPRPCPWVSCRHHLYLDITEFGGLKHNYPGELESLTESCSLDVADRGSHRLHQIGTILRITRERTRQIELRARERLAEGLSIAMPGMTADDFTEVTEAGGEPDMPRARRAGPAD